MQRTKVIGALLFICFVASLIGNTVGTCPRCSRKCNSDADCAGGTDGCGYCQPVSGGVGVCATGGTQSPNNCPMKGVFCTASLGCGDNTDGASVCDANGPNWAVGVSTGSFCNYPPCVGGSC